MSTVPDSFNISDLTEMLASAKSEDEIHTEQQNSDKEITPELITDTAKEMVEEALDRCADPVVHKAMIAIILQKMIEWHSTVADAQYEDGNERSGLSWARDAGKFQAMADILFQISLGSNDFLVSDD